MKDDRRDGDKPDISRRRFLGQASCAAVGTTAMLSTVLDLSMFNVLAATTPDYKALVCLFLSGGADSFNMLVPRGGAARAGRSGTATASPRRRCASTVRRAWWSRGGSRGPPAR